MISPSRAVFVAILPVFFLWKIGEHKISSYLRKGFAVTEAMYTYVLGFLERPCVCISQFVRFRFLHRT